MLVDSSQTETENGEERMKKSIALVTALILLASVFTAEFSAQYASKAETDTAHEAENRISETLPPTETASAAEAPSAALTQAADAYPVITDIENIANGVQLKWDRFQNNALYRVYYRRAAVYNGSWAEKYGGAVWTALATVRGCSYMHNGVKDAETGIYTIRCVNEQGVSVSGFCSQGWENTYYAAPQISSIHFDEEGVHLSWKRSWEAHGFWNGESYRIYRKTASSGWTRIALTSDGSYTDPDAAPGTVYIYTLRMTNADGSRFISSHNGGRSVGFDAYPYVTRLENTSGGVRLSWLKYEGASTYRVYWLSPVGWTRVGQVSSTSFTDPSVKNGETRYYTVRALNGKNEFISGFKREGWSVRYYAAPAFRSVSCTTEGVRLMWNRAQDAEDYRVYRVISGSWRMLAQTDAPEFTDTNVVSGQSYTYTLRMVSADGSRFMSDCPAGKSVTYVEAPVITGTVNTAAGARLTWDKAPGAYAYRVYYQNGGTWTRLATLTQTEYLDRGVANGEARRYTVRCLDKNGAFASDFYREGFVSTFYAPPVIKRFDAVNGGITVTWDRAEGAQAYRLYRRTPGTPWKMLAQTEASSFTDLTAQTGTAYSYTLRMVTSDGKRFMSDVTGGKSFTAIQPPEFTSVVNGDGSVTLRWAPVRGAYKYRVYSKDGATWKCFCTTGDLTCVDTGLKQDETRVYTIRCVDGSGQFISGFDADGRRHEYIASPALVSVKTEGGRNVVKWKANPAAAGYRVYRRSFGETGWTRIADFVNGDSYTDNDVQPDTVCTYTLRALDANGAFASWYRADNPYYSGGSVISGVFPIGGVDYCFDGGRLVNGYYREKGVLQYYRDGILVSKNQYNTGEYRRVLTRSEWLYELLRCVGSVPQSFRADDEQAVFELAKKRGLLTAYSQAELSRPVTRIFVAETMVKALEYPKRSVPDVIDIGAAETELATLAYYGYFVQDDEDRLYPYARVTADEFDLLLSQLRLYELLRGKTVVGFGDSIMYGAGNDGRGIAELIGEKYGMTCFNYALGGAVMGEYDIKSHIPDQLEKAVAAGQKADLILLDGGANDAYRQTGLGSLADGFDMSYIYEGSFSGGFEKTMWLINNHWKNTPVIYIRPHNMNLCDDSLERAYGERGLEIAKKWSAAPVDLYTNNDMNTEIQAICERYTYDNPAQGRHDGIHPTILGYTKYYLPPIEECIALAFK